MGSFTNYASQAVLNSLFGKTSAFGTLASEPTIYVGLSTTTPSADGTNVTEPSGDGYARVATASSDWDAATDADPAVLTNGNTITFPSATDSWGTVTDFVLYDAATGGNVIGSSALGTSKSPTDGDVPKFDPNSLTVSLT